MSDDAKPKDGEKPAAAAAAAAVEEQKAEAKAAAADADKAEEKAEKKKGGKAKKEKADGEKGKKKTLAQQRAEAETLVEDPKKDLGAPAEVLAEGAKRRGTDAKPKAPSNYTPQDWKAQTKAITIPKGKGTKLADCENVLKAVNKLKGDDPALKSLHSLMFGAPGTATKRKAHIREFAGFDADSVEEVKVKKLASLNTKKVDALKHYAAILDLETTGAKSELAERIVEFLAKPKASGKEYKFSVAGAKRKRSKSKSKSKKDDKDKPKRGPSAYILFANAKRAEVTEKYPDKKMTEVAKVLGEMWSDLSETKKNEWKAKAKSAKPGDGKAKSKSKSKSKDTKEKEKKKKKKEKEESDESGSESESEEEAGSDSDGAKDMSDDEDDKKKKKKEKKSEKKKEKKAEKKKDEKPKKEKKKESKKAKKDDEDEQPKKKKQKSDGPDDKLKAATKKAVQDGDEKMSVKSVLEQLKEKFGDDEITKHKATIKAWINEFFEAKMSKDKSKDK